MFNLTKKRMVFFQNFIPSEPTYSLAAKYTTPSSVKKYKKNSKMAWFCL